MINKKFLTYILIGGFNTVIDIIMISTLTFLFGNSNMKILIFNSISYSIGVLLGFILNGKFTFKDNNLTFKKFIKLYISALIGLVLNTIIVLVIINMFKLPLIIAKIIAACIIVFYNYTICKQFIFRSSNETK